MKGRKAREGVRFNLGKTLSSSCREGKRKKGKTGGRKGGRDKENGMKESREGRVRWNEGK